MTMCRPLVFALLFAALQAPVPARAEPACLPLSLFPQEQGDGKQVLDLGLIANVPTLCAYSNWLHTGLLGCWAVDPAAATLSVSTATSLPGHSQRGKTDANGCIEGYCPAPKPDVDELLMWAVSTDGAHAAILREGTLGEGDSPGRREALHVFDRRTKARTATIPLADDKAPANTNAGNSAVRFFYLGGTIYVAGSDAGPYIAVWAFEEGGRRLGMIEEASKPHGHSYSIFNGGLNVIGDSHIALVDAGLQTMLILSPAGETRQLLVRRVSRAPCTEQEMDRFNYWDYDTLSKGCRKTVARSFEPYIDLVPVRLPSGDFLAALSGGGRGTLAILDGNTLREKRRIVLPRCAK
jgi:hypothetical protein